MRRRRPHSEGEKRGIRYAAIRRCEGEKCVLRLVVVKGIHKLLVRVGDNFKMRTELERKCVYAYIELAHEIALYSSAFYGVN